MNFFKQWYIKTNLLIKEEKSVYRFNNLVLSLGLLFTVSYFYIDYIHGENGSISMRAGAILTLHGMFVQSTLNGIKEYTTWNVSDKEVLVKKEIPNKFKIQGTIAFYYILFGTLIWAFIDLLYIALK